ncbi:MAG TPA: helix-turn-helix domain-containing protein [Polyangiaceae bacterium]
MSERKTKPRSSIEGFARFFSDRQVKVLMHLSAHRGKDGAHLYEIARSVKLPSPSVLRGLSELVEGGLVKKHPPRPSSTSSGTFVRPYTLTANGQTVCKMLKGGS